MKVQNIECQLAQVQLKRYLAGEELPGELLTDLETHLEDCTECREAAKKQRAAAEPSAEQPKLKLAEEAAEKPARAKVDLSGLKNSKTLLLSGALAVVLIAMSTVLRDPTKLFGAKADEKAPAATVAANTSEPEAEESKPVTEETGANPDILGTALSASELVDEGGSDEEPTAPVDTEPTAEAPVTEPAKEPSTEPAKEPTKEVTKPEPKTTANGLNIPGKPTTQGQDVVVVGGSKPAVSKPAAKPTPRRAPRRTVTRKPVAKKPSSSGIRVYDSSGKRIK